MRPQVRSGEQLRPHTTRPSGLGISGHRVERCLGLGSLAIREDVSGDQPACRAISGYAQHLRFDQARDEREAHVQDLRRFFDGEFAVHERLRRSCLALSQALGWAHLAVSTGALIVQLSRTRPLLVEGDFLGAPVGVMAESWINPKIQQPG